jgi:hypothetical protein
MKALSNEKLETRKDKNVSDAYVTLCFFSCFWFPPSGFLKKWPGSVRGAEPRPLGGRARLIAALIMRPMVAAVRSPTN